MTTLTAATPISGGPMVGGVPGGRAPALGQTVALSGADIWRILRQRLVMIVAVWTLAILVTAGTTAVMWKWYPTYAAQARIHVESSDPVNVLDPLATRKMTAQENERIVRDEAMWAESEGVLDTVVKDAQVRETDWFREAQQDAEFWGKRLVDVLNDAVSAAPLRDSSFFVVTARTKDPADAALLANRVADIYLEKAKKRQKQQIQDASNQLQDELETATKAFRVKMQDLEDFRANSDVLSLTNERNETLATLTALEVELNIEVGGRYAQWETLRNVDPNLLPLTADIQALLDQDRQVVFLEQQVQSAEQSLAFLKGQGFGPRHKAVTSAQSSYDVALASLRTEEATKQSKYKNEMIEQAYRGYLEILKEVVAVQAQLTEAEAVQRDQNAQMARYLRKVEERELAHYKMDQIDAQLDAVAMTLRSSRMLQIEIASPAMPPKIKDSPRWRIWMPVGTLLGLGFAVGLALLLDIADKSVRSPRDIARHMAIPVLGTIPTSEDDEIEIERVETASIDAPHSVVAEAFRQLRANLFFSAPAEQQGVLMVTSPSADNGKTTVATNLAISIALSGRRVLLVDANFRRPAVPRLFPNAREEGLSNVLIGQSRLDDVVASTSVPGLDVVSPGPTPPNPAELLGSSYLRDLVVDARSRYDQVIFDGPPVLLVSDAAVLAGAVDGVLMVCQYRTTSRGALQRARIQLESINSRVFGVVLNKVETRAGGYFRKQYREFYDYQEPADADGGRPTKRLDIEQAAPGVGAASPPGGAGSDRAEPRGYGDARGVPSATEPDFRVMPDVEAAGLEDDQDVLGELRIDESLGLGEEVDDLTPSDEFSVDGPGGAITGDDDLDLGEDLDLDKPVDLGDSTLSPDDDDYDGGSDETPERDDPGGRPGR